MGRQRIALGGRRVGWAGALWLTAAALAAANDAPAPSADGAASAISAVVDVEPSYYRALTVTRSGTSSAVVRKQAIAELPLQELAPPARSKAERVLNGLGLFRRLPTLEFEVEPTVYHYLLQRPDVAVSTWRAMDISKFQLKQVGASVYHADAGDGSVGTIEVWRSTRDDTLIYCDGAFKSPLIARPLVARSIMRLRTRMIDAEGGRARAECTGELFVEFPSQTVETIAKLISPISHSIADRNFKQLSLYAHLMSQAMVRQPGWVKRLTQDMDCSDEQKAAFLDLAAQVHAAAQQRADRSAAPLPVDDILAPIRLPNDREAVAPVKGTSR
jgi:hypothetical protein